MARYTALTNAEIDTILTAYGRTAEAVTTLDGGAANSSYLVHTRSDTLVLTVLDNHDRDSAGRLAKLLEHLEHHDIAAPVVLADGQGRHLASFGDRLVMVKPHLPGQVDGTLTPTQYEAVGALLAQVHAVPVPAWLTVNGRRLQPGWRDRVATFADTAFAEWFTDVWATAGVIESLDAPRGLVHGDVFTDNLVFGENGAVSVLDWETACADLLILDLGMAIVGLCRRDGAFLPAGARHLINGYEKVRPLDLGERSHLLDSTRYASLIIAYHRYLRHHVTHPDPAKQHLYREVPTFVANVEAAWTTVLAA